MQHTQTHAQHFFCFQQMSDIRPTVVTACRTLASFFNRLRIQLIFCIEQIQLSMIRVDMAMAAVSAWINTVKEINSRSTASRIFAGVPTPIR